MNDLQLAPADLTEPQWLLLRHLNKYSTPFYTEFLYAQFSEHQIDRLPFYYMFFSLAVLNYIRLDGHGEQVPGRKQDFRYAVTPKGRKVVAQYTEVSKVNNASAVAKKRPYTMIAAYLPRTIQLRDYSLDH